MEKLITKLQEFGLTGREAELYLALLQKRELTAPEIAKLTTISRTKTYDILQNLVKKRVCTESYRNGSKYYSGIKPTIAIENLISVEQAELDRKKQHAEQFQTELMSLFVLSESVDDPMDYIEVLNDPGQIRERWLAIQEGTTRELLVFTKPPYTKALNDNIELEEQVIERRVKVMGVYESAGLETVEEKQNLADVIRMYQRLGEESRIAAALPMKLVISDETISMFALNDRISLKPSITTMIVNHPSFAMAMKKVFESYWNISATVDEFCTTI